MAQTDSNTSKNKFKHLLFHQRTLIEFMVKNGYKPADIARELGVNRSTVSRELNRGSVKQIIAGKTVLKYFAVTAQEIADRKKANVGRKPKFFNCSEFLSHADKLMKEETLLTLWSVRPKIWTFSAHRRWFAQALCTDISMLIFS